MVVSKRMHKSVLGIQICRAYYIHATTSYKTTTGIKCCE